MTDPFLVSLLEDLNGDKYPNVQQRVSESLHPDSAADKVRGRTVLSSELAHCGAVTDTTSNQHDQ